MSNILQPLIDNAGFIQQDNKLTRIFIKVGESKKDPRAINADVNLIISRDSYEKLSKKTKKKKSGDKKWRKSPSDQTRSTASLDKKGSKNKQEK